MIDPLKIHALADGELSPEETSALNEEIACCEKSCAELNAIRNLKSALSRTQPVRCEDTWQGCVKRLNEIDKARRIEFAVGRYAWGLCGVIVIAIALGGYLTRIGSSGVVRSGDVRRMVSSLVPFSSFKGGDSPEAARRWLSQNVKDAPVPADRLQLVNGVIGYTPDGQHQVARLTLRDSNGQMTLIMIGAIQQVDGLEPAMGQFKQGMMEDMHCVCWTDRGWALMLVGDRSTEDLQQVASAIVRSGVIQMPSRSSS